MWKLIDRISGQVYEHKLRYVLLQTGKEIIEDYKRDGIETYIGYINNNTYELKEYKRS